MIIRGNGIKPIGCLGGINNADSVNYMAKVISVLITN